MAIQILGADGATVLKVDSTSGAGRVTQYDTNGNPVCDVSSLSNVLNALNAAATITLGGQSTVGFDVESTSGTITLSFEATINNVNWFALSASPVAGGATVTSTTTNGQWVASVGGFFAVRARVSAISGGASMTVSLVATPGTSASDATVVTGTVTVVQPVPSALQAEVGGLAPSGAAPVGNPVLVAGTDGTTGHSILTDTTGKQIVVGAGATGAPAGGIVSVQGVTGGTALPVSGNITATPPADVIPATQNITVQDTASTTAAGANGAVYVTGTPTAGSTALFNISTIEAIKVQVTGTWTGTLTLESSLDGGTTWYSSGVHQSGTAYTTNNFTANFIGGLNTSGATNFRVRATAAWTGTATVLVVETKNVNSVYVSNPIHISDGVTQSINATIKAASTGATGTDTALVTAFSPNTPLPAGSNTIGNVGVIGTAGVTGTVTVVQPVPANLQAEVGGLAASGAAPVGNPVLVAGYDGATAHTILTDTTGRQIVVGAGATGAPAGGILSVQGVTGGVQLPVTGTVGLTGTSTIAGTVNLGANPAAIQSNATVTTNGSQVVTGNNFGAQEIQLIINVTAAPTGTTPTLTYTLQELDPGNGTTVEGNIGISPVINAVGVYYATLYTTSSNAVKVSWTITGATASFTGVYSTVVTKTTSGNIFPTGAQHVQVDPVQLFADTYSTGVFDTTNLWNANSAVGGGTFAIAVGTLTLGSGTTANGYSFIQSQPTFPPAAPGWIQVTNNLNIESPVLTNAYRFWGLGTNPATPTAAAPLTDAVGFEIGTTGKLFAVCFAGGTRNAVQDLSVATGNGTQPSNASAHDYTIYFRGDRIWWLIDGAVVAQIFTGALGPANNNLPLKLITIANSTPPTSTATISSNSVFTGTTNNKSIAISDGVYGFRQTTVKAASTATAATDLALVVGLSPNSPLPAGTNSIGNVGVTGTVNVTGTGTVGAPAAGVVSVQGVTGGVSVPVSGFVGLTGTSTVTANQGTANTLANAWSVKITDTTNGPAAVKAASTQSAATDQALVVALSPASAQTRAATTTVTGVASSASSVTILAANSARLGAVITNSSTSILYIKYAATAASIASGGYTVAVAITNGTHEVYSGYTGAITGIWASVNGFCNVTEITV